MILYMQQQEIQTLQAEVVTLTAVTDALTALAVAANQTLATHAAHLAAVDTQLAQHGSHLVSLDAQASAAAGRLDALDSAVAAIDGTLAVHTAGIARNALDVASLRNSTDATFVLLSQYISTLQRNTSPSRRLTCFACDSSSQRHRDA